MKKISFNKTVALIVGIVIGIILLLIMIFVGINNSAISKEEQINEAKSSIDIQEKRRVDLIYNLVDVCSEYAKYEKETLRTIISERNTGVKNANEARLAVNAVVEKYPQLKANESYKKLMTELAVTENKMAEIRDNYNIQVKDYNKFVRRFPNNSILKIMGYEKNNYEYLDFEVSPDAPQKLFDSSTK